MYSQVIEWGDDTLAANRRVRAQSERLRANATALLFTYCLHRFPHPSGASDDQRCRPCAPITARLLRAH
jgi:hypothetical protein